MLKGCSGKFMPIRQWFTYDSTGMLGVPATVVVSPVATATRRTTWLLCSATYRYLRPKSAHRGASPARDAPRGSRARAPQSRRAGLRGARGARTCRLA